MGIHRSAPSISFIAVLAAALGCLAWSTAATSAGSGVGMEMSKKPKVCSDTARLAQKSCDLDAPSEYQLALGKCANLLDPTARSDC